MKAFIVSLILVGFALPTFATDKAELDHRIRKLTARFESWQAKQDKVAVAGQLRKAQGIILLDRTKAGFVFAYQGGSGVALVKDEKSGQWSAPAFLSASEASLGFQIGGQQSFVVILLMNTNVTHMLTEASFEFGGEARGTAGGNSAGAQGLVTPTEAPVLIYSDHKGLFGGAAVKGGVLSPDTDANVAYYNQAVTMPEILFKNQVKPTEATTQLVRKITAHSAP